MMERKIPAQAIAKDQLPIKLIHDRHNMSGPAPPQPVQKPPPASNCRPTMRPGIKLNRPLLQARARGFLSK